MIKTNATSSASGDVEALREELLATFRRALGRQDFEADDGFLASGGDSLTAIETILDIENRYGVTLSAAEFMALDTAEYLARRIASAFQEHKSEPGTEREADTRESTMLSVVQDGERAHPLVCAYGSHGEAAYAITLAGLLPTDQPVATLQIRTKEAQGERVRSFREMETSIAKNIFKLYAHRSPVLLGYSLGAHVALAIGHELTRYGSPPALVVVLDDEADLDRRHFGALQLGSEPANITDTLRLALQYSPAEPIATRLVYFRSAENDAYYRSDPTSGWGEIATGGVTHFDVSANHLEFAREHGLRQIVSKLLEEIASPCQDSPRPSEAQSLRFEARRAAREGHLSTELACLNRAIEQDNEQPAWFYANLAEALFQKGETAAALAALSKARLQENWQLSLDLRFLDEIKRQGLQAERDDILRRLSAVASDHPSVHEQKALAYFKLGLWKECHVELKAGLNMQPQHFWLSRLLVKYFRHMRAWPELKNVTERLVEKFPDAKVFRTALIVAYTEIGSPAQALQFRDTIVADPRPDFGGLMALGKALLRCGRSAEGLEIAELAARAAPSRPNAHLLRAKCLNSLGHPAQAAAARRQARDLRAKLVTSGIR